MSGKRARWTGSSSISARSAAKGVLASITFASAVWVAIGLGATPPALAVKQSDAPPAGVIGAEDRVRLADFAPQQPQLFPGWEDVQDAVVRIACNGGATGGGVLIGDGSRMISAAHVFLNDDGTLNPYRARCLAVHPSGDAVQIRAGTLKSGGFTIPDGLGTHFSVAITERDWVVVALERVPRRAMPLPVAGAEHLALEQGTRVINIAGSQDNFEIEGFLAQVCTYFGAPPTASDMGADGQIVGRLAQPGDALRVARYDCDLGRGGSGSPIIGWFEGTPYIWGILTDSLRGAERCPEVRRVACYSAGPLVTAMDVIP